MNVSVEGAELFTSALGRGPTLLVLCSMGTSSHEWLAGPVLPERYRLVFVDLRGSGRSTGDPSDLTFDRLAEDLEAVRTALGIDRVAVFAHSILGALAIEYGRRRPRSVSSVVTAGTPPLGDMARVGPSAASFFEADASEGRKRILRENLAKLPAGASPGQWLLAQTPQRFFDPAFDAAPMIERAISSPRFFQHLFGPLASRWDVRTGSDSLKVPLFLAQGRYDYVVPHTLWSGIPETLPKTTFRLFEKSGHQPFFEEPELFADSVADWMSGSE
jgi:proline iminopeptidase